MRVSVRGGEGVGEGEEASDSDALPTSARGEGGSRMGGGASDTGSLRQAQRPLGVLSRGQVQGARKPVVAEMPSSWGRAVPCHRRGGGPGHVTWTQSRGRV